MLRLLPLCLLLAACGGDEAAPVVVTDTDIAVVEPVADSLADGSADAADVEADASAPAPTPAPTPAPAPAPAPNSDVVPNVQDEPAPSTVPTPAALAALPGETAYYKDGQEEVIIFQRGSSPNSGTLVYTPHPDVDTIYGEWEINGNTLTFLGTIYTFDAADGAGTIQFQSPQGEMVLTIAAG